MLTSALLLAGAAGADGPAFDFDALLARTGALEAERSAITCRWTEVTRIEQLDDNGAVAGSVTRTYAVIAHGPEPISRTKTDEKVEGEVNRLLREDRPPKKGDRKDMLSPFHPEARPMFDLALVSRSEQAVVVSITPKEPSEKHFAGTAQLDPVSGRVLHLTLQPSKMPTFVEQLKMDLRLVSTPCGNHPRDITAEGTAGLLFVKFHFRSRTELSSFARLDEAHP